MLRTDCGHVRVTLFPALGRDLAEQTQTIVCVWILYISDREAGQYPLYIFTLI